MLLTRCPSCTTAFRITAELLRQASGQVRCGRCNHVFPAFAHLEEVPNEPDAHGIGSYAPSAEESPEPAADSPTSFPDDLEETSEHEILAFHEAEVTPHLAGEEADAALAPVTADELVEIFDSDPSKTGESGNETRATENRALLATIDPDEPLDFELPPDVWDAFLESEGLTDAADDRSEAAAVMPDEQTDTGEAPWPEDDHESVDDTDEQEQPAEWLDTQLAADAEAPEEDLAETGADATPASDYRTAASRPSEAEWVDAADAPQSAAPGAGETERERAALMAEDSAEETEEDWAKDTAEYWAAAMTADSATETDPAGMEETAADWATATEDEPTAETAEDWAAEAEADAADEAAAEWAKDTGDHWAAAMADDSAAETDPAGTEETAADWAAEADGHVIDLEQARAEAEPADNQPWAWATRAAGITGSPRDQRRWGIAAAGLGLLLVLQLAHHYRNSLASQALLGPVVRAVYGTLNLDLAPNWDVEQYQIDDWVATAGPNQDGQGRLTITATLLNRGPRNQPHPYVRLELKDRWDESVGSRVFKPGEYLPQPPGPGELMAAGARVPAQLAVLDPGEDAYGFELDVCMPSAADQLRCANDKVF